MGLAQALHRMGQMDLVRQQYLEVQRLEPENPGVRSAVTQLLEAGHWTEIQFNIE